MSGYLPPGCTQREIDQQLEGSNGKASETTELDLVYEDLAISRKNLALAYEDLARAHRMKCELLAVIKHAQNDIAQYVVLRTLFGATLDLMQSVIIKAERES